MILLAAFTTSVSATVFSDTEDHWAKYSIDYVTNEGYFVGTSNDLFSPDLTMTRGMFVTVLSRICGEDRNPYQNTVFSDVKNSDYFSSAVAWAYTNNIVAGTGASSFSPDSPVTREQICVILENYFEYAGISPEEKNVISLYQDDLQIHSWAYSAVYAMQKSGYLVGSDGNFRPQDQATRAECASVFARVCGNFYSSNDSGLTPDDNHDVTLPDDTTEDMEKGSLVGVFTGTFYCPCAACNGSWAGMTSSGEPMVVGETIAVDPRIIPLGSTVYVEFSSANLQHLNGVYKATDTGGNIKNYRVDVLVEDHNISGSYGIDYGVKIYLMN